MRPIAIDGFEAKFSAAADPWRCRDDPAEALKRRRTLAATRGLAASALDLGCGDGATTRALSRRALRAEAVDAAPAALASARAWCEGAPVRFRLARLPEGAPRRRFRRVLVSELAYYLRPHQIERLAAAVAARLAPGGEAVTAHHVTPFADAATPPARAEALLRAALGRRLRADPPRRYGRYVIARFTAPASADRARRAGRPRRSSR